MATDLNLSTLAKEFSDEDAARELLEKWRWPNGAACPHCGGCDPYKLTPRATSKKPGRKGLYKCRACRKQFTVTVGTVFEDSRIPISKWMMGAHLLASSKKGISAHQLHRNLGISYKAAWFMAHRLRFAMASGPMAELLKGVVEADETYVGGRRRIGPTNKADRAKLAVGRPGPKDKKLTPVVAMVERGGRVRVMPVARVNYETMRATLVDNIDTANAHLMTDELPVYPKTAVNAGFKRHQMIRHMDKQYVRGNVHTNTVEGFFSLLKRGINGTFHHISKGHLHRYCSEFEFRYNTRTALGYTDGERASLLVKGAEGKRLTYKMPSGPSAN
jgi:transposase-like protein